MSAPYYSRLKPQSHPKIRQAMMQLVMTQPFWGTLALHMDFVPDENIPTAATDGKRIYYNTKFIDSLTTSMVLFVIAHEVGHPMLHHLNRRYVRDPGDTGHYGCDENGKPFGRDPKVFNIAGDRIINRMLKDSGFQIWEKCIIGPESDTDKTTEEIYRELMQQQRQPNGHPGQQSQPSGGQQQGQSSGGGQPGQSDDEQGNGENPGGIPGHEDNQQRTGRKPAGPGCEDTQGQMDPGGDMRAPAPDVKEQDWNEIVVKAAAIAKAQGHLPASIEGIITEATEPQYPFYLILEQFIDESTKGDDSSWHRPHRDYFSRGIIMPGPYEENISHVVIAFDTSGSVPDADLSRFARITGDIMRRLKPKRLTLIQCDADVTDEGVLEIHDHRDWPKEIKSTGRGGTRFEPVFEWVSANRIKPSCLVYMTDLMGSFPKKPVQYPVFWASTEKGSKAPFGTTVFVNQ